MNESFHVRITVKDNNGKARSYVENNVYYRDKNEAIEAGRKAFKNTRDVIMTEVFQSGVARPVALFQ